MRIEAYEFGHIIIDGVTYRQDLLIWPGHVKTDWWRQEGHLLQIADVGEVLEAAPEILVVGTGAYGNMEVDRDLEAFLEEKGIRLLARPTKEACRIINEESGRRRLAAALHLTC